MTTASTNTVLDHTTDAGFRTWGNELMTALITTLGLTQTADTGQLAFPMTVTTRPAINTAAGYYILRFNDTLQATTPIFIKVEVGTGASAAVPALWITVGTGSNGSGTLTGASTRIYCGNSSAVTSTVTNFVSRACYNPAQGVLWIDWKQAAAAANTDYFSFLIHRSVDNTGAPTATAVGFQGQSTTNAASGANGTPFQWYNAATTVWLGPVNGTPVGVTYTEWCATPYQTAAGGGSTIVGTAGQVFPCFQYAPTASAPALGVTNAHAVCLQAEIAIGATVTLTILGSTSLTYIAGMATSTSMAFKGLGISTTGFAYLRLWQ
jgi:hypothetical protein